MYHRGPGLRPRRQRLQRARISGGELFDDVEWRWSRDEGDVEVVPVPNLHTAEIIIAEIEYRNLYRIMAFHLHVLSE